MPVLVNTVGLELPDDFPADSYNAIHAQVSPKRTPNPPTWPEWAGAWNAVAYRFQACEDHHIAFTTSVERDGDAPPPMVRYLQERELFCFFMSGLSAIESLLYGLHAVASMMDSAEFPMTSLDDKRNVNPAAVRKRFQSRFPCDGLTAEIGNLLTSPEYKEWDGLRNILAHRQAPGRVIHRSNASTSEPATLKELEVKAGKAQIVVQIVVDGTTTASRRHWLGQALTRVLIAAERFTIGRASLLPPQCRA